MTTIGQVPQSQALAEATGDSLGELMSRDPEGYSRQDRNAVVAAMRQQRERMAAAEASGTSKPTSRTSPPKAISSAKPEDLGL